MNEIRNICGGGLGRQLVEDFGGGLEWSLHGNTPGGSKGVADGLNFAYHVHDESLQGLNLYCTDDIGASECTFRAHLKIAD